MYQTGIFLLLPATIGCSQISKKKELTDKKLRSNEEVIVETEAYFEAKNKSLDRDYIDE